MNWTIIFVICLVTKNFNARINMIFRFLQLFTCFFIFTQINAHAFDKVVIWGHKFHSHTHSYIHNAFFKTFQYMGYDTYWFDDNDELSNFNFSNSLFITEGQVDKRIPIRSDCEYILHNCSSSKYQSLPSNNWFNLQVYTDDVLSLSTATKIETCIYYDLKNKCCYMPWATDLLPDEIEKIKQELTDISQKSTVIWWIGTIGEGKFGNINELSPFMKACQENEISFTHVTGLSVEKNIELIKKSYIAPAIVGKWQQEVGYIPCRIFKNISYGKLGVTNSYRVYELLEKKIIYNSDTYELFYDAQERTDNISLDEIKELMDIVKTKHTYINRIQTLLYFLEIIKNNY